MRKDRSRKTCQAYNKALKRNSCGLYCPLFCPPPFCYATAMPSAPDPAPPTPKPRKRWLPRLRFSLRTLVALVLTVGATAFLYRDWEPWREVAVVEEQPNVELPIMDTLETQSIAISPDGEFFTTAQRLPDNVEWQWHFWEDEKLETNLNVMESSSGKIISTLKGH